MSRNGPGLIHLTIMVNILHLLAVHSMSTHSPSSITTGGPYISRRTYMPVIQMQPSSTSGNPTNSTLLRNTLSPSYYTECLDSTRSLNLLVNCSWAESNMKTACSFHSVQEHCPHTCNLCTSVTRTPRTLQPTTRVVQPMLQLDPYTTHHQDPSLDLEASSNEDPWRVFRLVYLAFLIVVFLVGIVCAFFDHGR